jgi:hypothetical protein
MRVLFFRDHEISRLGPASADPAEVGVRAAGAGGAGEDCAVGHLVPRPGDGERAQARSQHYLAAPGRR